jgi:hypothetical protein
MHRGQALQELRKHVASTLADEKAYDLPAVCVRYGLADGTEQEAFNSKFKYAHRRVTGLDPSELARVARALLEERPNADLAEQLAMVEEFDQRKISQITRRRLIDELEAVHLPGRLNDLVAFLEPVFPIDSLSPAYPHVFGERTLRDEIVQHCIRNDDWANSELLTFLEVLKCSQQRFFAFLERLVDPLVRDEPEQERLVQCINPLLHRDGYALLPNGQISGYVIYAVRPVTAAGVTPADQDLTSHFQKLDEAGIHELWEKALKRRTDDPEGAITIARTLLERTCKHILDEEQIVYPNDADLPKLWSLCSERLNLAPSQHTQQVFKAILGNCQSVVNYLGTIRNRLGDSHGQGGRPVRPRPRHAQLVVNLAGAMSTFLLTTWLEQDEQAKAEAISKAAAF